MELSRHFVVEVKCREYGTCTLQHIDFVNLYGQNPPLKCMQYICCPCAHYLEAHINVLEW